ncbi:hypothetical protein D3C75_711000 [compost metagenome]
MSNGMWEAAGPIFIGGGCAFAVGVACLIVIKQVSNYILKNAIRRLVPLIVGVTFLVSIIVASTY